MSERAPAAPVKVKPLQLRTGRDLFQYLQGVFEAPGVQECFGKKEVGRRLGRREGDSLLQKEVDGGVHASLPGELLRPEERLTGGHSLGKLRLQSAEGPFLPEGELPGCRTVFSLRGREPVEEDVSRHHATKAGQGGAQAKILATVASL